MTQDGLEISDAPDRRRFEAVLDGKVVGFLEYSRDGASTVLPHTEVDPAYENRGIASRLARAALDDARARGSKVVPVCPFVSAYLDAHPEYADLDSRPASGR
ncbi:MAG TPA: GNAT family N-acetyltransferase [Actinopolymorphaceae bacterium]